MRTKKHAYGAVDHLIRKYDYTSKRYRICYMDMSMRRRDAVRS
jgi:hypothetical protein